MNKEVTVIITSTGRWDLLRITIESFLKYNTYDIKEFIISDDSGQEYPSWCWKDFTFINWFTSKQSGIVKNQIASIDFLWSKVKTPYAFTMEDDWEFLRPGFIEASIEVLEQDEKILMVWLAALEDNNVHPVYWKPILTVKENRLHNAYGVLKSSGDLWSGTRFNPALKRKSDYDLIAPFSKHTDWDPAKPWKSEADISKVYHKLGFKGAVLPQTYIKHIGDGRHVGV